MRKFWTICMVSTLCAIALPAVAQSLSNSVLYKNLIFMGTVCAYVWLVVSILAFVSAIHILSSERKTRSLFVFLTLPQVLVVLIGCVLFLVSLDLDVPLILRLVTFASPCLCFLMLVVTSAIFLPSYTKKIKRVKSLRKIRIDKTRASE
jgi:hypothetical protein